MRVSHSECGKNKQEVHLLSNMLHFQVCALPQLLVLRTSGHYWRKQRHVSVVEGRGTEERGSERRGTEERGSERREERRRGGVRGERNGGEGRGKREASV